MLVSAFHASDLASFFSSDMCSYLYRRTSRLRSFSALIVRCVPQPEALGFRALLTLPDTRFAQRKIKRRTCVDCPFGPRAAAVADNDPSHDCQSQACAFKFFTTMQPVERPKQALHVTHIKANAVVSHEDDEFLRAFRRTNLDLCRLARTRVFDRVRNEIHEYLP